MAMDLSKSRNAEKMRAIQEKSKEQTNGLVTINVPMDQIDENPDNELVYNMEKVDAIAKSIEEVGFFGTISVFKKPDGRYEISSGHTRFRAMKKVGGTSIPCTVSPYPDEIKRGLILLSSNANNRVMKPMDWANQIEYYYNLMRKAKKDFGKGEQSYSGRLRDQAADFFNMSPVNIQRYHSLLKLTPELQELANDPEYPYSAFVPAASMEEDEQKKLFELISEEAEENTRKAENGEAISGISRTRITQLINGIKNKPDNTAQQEKSYGGFVTNAIHPAEPVIAPLSEQQDFKEVTGEVEAPSEFTAPQEGTDSPNFSHEGDAGDYYAEFSDSDDSGDDSGFVERDYSKESDVAGSSNNQSGKAVAESKLGACTPEIERIANGQYEIFDKDLVRSYVKRLKAAIEKIEARL